MCSNAAEVHFFSQHLLVTFGYQNPNNHNKEQLPMQQQSSPVFDCFPPFVTYTTFSATQTNVATTITLW